MAQAMYVVEAGYTFTHWCEGPTPGLRSCVTCFPAVVCSCGHFALRWVMAPLIAPVGVHGDAGYVDPAP
jgi:hypothetical protein